MAPLYAFALMFAVIALTILMASVLLGLNFANRLVAPIRRLMAGQIMSLRMGLIPDQRAALLQSRDDLAHGFALAALIRRLRLGDLLGS